MNLSVFNWPKIAARIENVTTVTSTEENTIAQRRADGLVTIAETTLRQGPKPLSSQNATR